MLEMKSRDCFVHNISSTSLLPRLGRMKFALALRRKNDYARAGMAAPPQASSSMASSSSAEGPGVTTVIPDLLELQRLKRLADCSLLIVEDDQFQRTVLLSMLESMANISTVRDTPNTGLSPKAQHRRIGSSPSPSANSTCSSPERKKLNLHVEWSQDGERGWELLSSGVFHIAFIDINLPGVSGLDLSWCYSQLLMQTNAAKANTADAAAPHQTIIIACTADLAATRDVVDSYGIHDVLQKCAPCASRARTRLRALDARKLCRALACLSPTVDACACACDLQAHLHTNAAAYDAQVDASGLLPPRPVAPHSEPRPTAQPQRPLRRTYVPHTHSLSGCELPTPDQCAQPRARRWPHAWLTPLHVLAPSCRYPPG